MPKLKTIMCVALISSFGFGAPVFARGPQEAPADIAAKLNALILAHRASVPNIPGEALTVVTPQWRWSGKTGTSDGITKLLHPDQMFRTASVTKPFTAAAILRLMEMGKINIQAPLSRYITKTSDAALRSGEYDPDKMTIQQLLAHTSGLFDYANDPAYSARVMADPLHQWTRLEQIEHAMTHGKPIDLPGKSYSYSDTGYVLLGEIIERQTGQNLGKAVRALLRFNRLKLRLTYWEQLEPKVGRARIASHFFGAADMTRANPSFDLFGGGGIVSNVGELATFYRALVRGEVFDDRRTLAVMMTTVGAKRPTGDAGVHNNALYLVRVGRWLCWGHAGFWGQLVAYCPENDLTFAWTFNQVDVSNDNMRKFADDLAAIVAP